MTGKARKLPKLFHAVPDTVLDGADFEGLTVRAASLRGDDHRYMTEPRQDSMALWPLALESADALLCCVADGVGSQPNSHMGSQLACWLLRNEFERGADARMWDDSAAFCGDIIGRVASGMLTDAEARRIHPETLSTTLVAALVELTPPDRPRRALVLRVGDSTAFMLRDGVFRECFPDAHKNEDVQGSGTSALPGNPGMAEAGAVTLGNDDVLVLCTDGLSGPMHNDEVKEQLVRWWSTGPVPGILEFGWQLGFRAKSYGDDRSAACVWGR
jgi:serine/threonine protein phosphatase PrpC